METKMSMHIRTVNESHHKTSFSLIIVNVGAILYIWWPMAIVWHHTKVQRTACETGRYGFYLKHTFSWRMLPHLEPTQTHTC